MAETNRPLLRWFASKNPWFSALKVVPFVLIYIIILFETGIDFLFPFWFVNGIIVWSLFEYVVHRWVYHTPIRSSKIRWFVDAFHEHHHRNLDDYEVLNAGFLLSYPITIIVLSVVFLSTWSLYATACFGLGMTLYYIFYEIVHYLIHYKCWSGGYMSFIQKYHLFHHHENWNRNFGNTISFWDRIFGSYDGDYRDFEISESMRKDFIKD